MANAKKLSQQELRQLMREKSQSKKVSRVESPLAKYDEKNQLWCVMCNIIIDSEALWTSHLINKTHKKKIEELKQKQKKTTSSNSDLNSLEKNNLKRNLYSKNKDDHVVPAKISKFDKIADFSKKEMLIKKAKISSEEADNSNEKKNATPQMIDPSLPKDFFDDTSSNSSNTHKNNENMDIDSQNVVPEAESNALPAGFFDDPMQDAKARKINYKDPLEEQMEIFRKEIAEESLVSEVIEEEELDNLQKEKFITEIEDQLSNWIKVDHYQKKIEKIHETLKNKTTVDNMTEKENDSNDESDTDLEDINFWRCKGVFH